MSWIFLETQIPPQDGKTISRLALASKKGFPGLGQRVYQITGYALSIWVERVPTDYQWEENSELLPPSICYPESPDNCYETGCLNPGRKERRRKKKASKLLLLLWRWLRDAKQSMPAKAQRIKCCNCPTWLIMQLFQSCSWVTSTSQP